ncbi:MAG: lysyl-tRNA synthetase class 2 [Myxococcota bacterium]
MYTFDPDRIAKLAALREAGIEPFPHNLRVANTIAEVRALIGERDSATLGADETVVTIAGRLMSKRDHGKTFFAEIQDRSGRIQVFVKMKIIGEESFTAWKTFDQGDHIHVSGRFMRTRTGEPTVRVEVLQLAAKSISSMPDAQHSLTPEFRNRHRYVDLFMNEESRETFRRRSAVIRYIREFFENRDFMEVETPMLQAIPGGASARPFVTHHNALDMELYMRIAPELYLKRLVVGGFERVYEINRNFRNEGISTKHNPEFTMLEFYWAYANWHDLMDLTEEMCSGLAEAVCGSTEVPYNDVTLNFARPWRRLPMATAIAEATGLSEEAVRDPEQLRARWLVDHPNDATNPRLPTTMGKWFELLFDAYVEASLIQPTFITHFPTEISPLSRRNDDDPEIVDRFELFIYGREIANGFKELNDPVDQAGRFAAQVDARDSGDDEAMFFDADYIKALSYGMPPTAGEGIGIDRLVMLLANQNSIRDVILFPTLRHSSES